MTSDNKLTSDDLTTIISRFKNSMHRLSQNRDYLEEESDLIILRKLIDMKWDKWKNWSKSDLPITTITVSEK